MFELIISMYLVIGLGNPGAEYSKTRHNIGWQSLERLANQLGLPAATIDDKFQGIVRRGQWQDTALVLLQPTTFMNLSGESASKVAHYFKIPTNHIIVIFDDYSLPLGQIRLRPNGSAGGHNGLKSLIQHLGPDFIRIRLGINPDHPVSDLASFVLDRFSPSEQSIVAQMIESVPTIIEDIIHSPWDHVMSKWNTKLS